MAEPRYNNPRAFIESYDIELRGKLAVKIFLFCVTQGNWTTKSNDDYWDISSIYNPKSPAYKLKTELTSEPFNLNDFVIISIKENTVEWLTESCMIWDDYIKAP